MSWLTQIATRWFNGTTFLNKVIIGDGLTYDATTETISALGNEDDFQWSVIDILGTAPVSPTLNDAYLVATPGTGFSPVPVNDIAIWDGAAWADNVPTIGDLLYNANQDGIGGAQGVYQYTGTAWIFVGKVAILQGGNTFGSNMIIATLDNANMVLRTHNVTRITIVRTGEIIFNSLTGTGNRGVGIDSTGLLSRVDFDANAIAYSIALG